ncbi:hypothetical protein [Candidatus Igneacidithiobacillus taiwanensis]|uniref:hypothetical protein n=1 Tax=Candidatus Igneacidithiobacillus taiwanensis TaxID=1945924 RepID=UPI0028A06D9D|nr:hypothetical protein [Candidatus Igneacidithiobacillus taiwanensis]
MLSPEKNKESQTPLQYRSDGRSHHEAFAHATLQYVIFGGLFSFRANDGHVCDAISEPTGLSRHETAFQFIVKRCPGIAVPDQDRIGIEWNYVKADKTWSWATE